MQAPSEQHRSWTAVTCFGSTTANGTKCGICGSGYQGSATLGKSVAGSERVKIGRDSEWEEQWELGSSGMDPSVASRRHIDHQETYGEIRRIFF